MARSGGGNFYYIESAGQIPDYIASEVGEALEVVARDVTLTAQTSTQIRVSSLAELPTHRRRGRTHLDLGSLVSDQLYRTLLKVTFPPGTAGQEQRVAVGLADREGALGTELTCEVCFTYAEPAALDGQDRDHAVDCEVARSYASRARLQALELNRAGHFKRAAHLLMTTAKRIRSYAKDDPELLALVVDLENAAEEYGRVMRRERQLSQHAGAWQVLQSRSTEGAALRMPPDPADEDDQ
jgi:hypothetical protein